MRTLYALVSEQGTACAETVLIGDECNNPAVRAAIERQFCTGKPDAPIAGTWTDVSDNDYLQQMVEDA